MDSDGNEELINYLNEENKEDDPFSELNEWLDIDQPKKKKPVSRSINVKRDENGKRLYPYKGTKRYARKKKRSSSSKGNLTWKYLFCY